MVFFEKAINMWEKIAGASCFQAAESRGNLAVCYLSLGDNLQAKLLMEADKIKRKHAREMKKIEIVEEEVPKPAVTVQKPRKSKSIYQNQQSTPEISQQPAKSAISAVQQPYQSPAFDIKFW